MTRWPTIGLSRPPGGPPREVIAYEKFEIVRIYPKFVSLLGAAGIATTITYLVGVYLVFQPEWEAWAEFFVPYSIPLLFIPYLLLIGHLYLRTHLGEWYLRQGAVDEAIAYTRERLDHHLMRSRKEALINRITLARAQIFQADYPKAHEVLTKGYSVPTKGAQGLDIHRWRMEAALRMENLVLCHEAWEAVAEVTRPKRSRVYVLACRAELAAREQNREAFKEAVEDALWIDADNDRVLLSQVIGIVQFASDPVDLEEGLAMLEAVFESTLDDVPGRKAELLGLRAELLYKLERYDEAIDVIEVALEEPADSRAEFEVRRIHQLVADANEQTTDSNKPN